jgi:hypothetical protein
MKTIFLSLFSFSLLCLFGQVNTGLAQVNLQIPSTNVAPIIDGTIDAVWGTSQSQLLEHTIVPVGGSVSSSDFSAYFKTLWDTKALYVLAVVTDDSKINDSGEIWQDDAVEVYIDIDNNKLSTFGTNDYAYTFRWNDPAITGVPNTGVEFKMVGTTTGYILEVKFPWSTLGLTSPQSGVLLGYDLQIHDDDDGGARDNKFAWFATTDDSWYNPSLFATAKLVGDVTVIYPAEKPKISVQHGFFKKPFDVVISTAVDEMKIYYTLDGSDPATSLNAMVTTSPAKINIDPQNFQDRGKTPGVVLRARAKSDKYDFSPNASCTYLFVDKMDIQTSYPGHDWPPFDIKGQSIDLLMDSRVLNDARYKNLIDDALLEVPSISITTDNSNLFDPYLGIYVNASGRGLDWERPASIELMNPNGTDGFQIDAGLRIRGGYSRTSGFSKHAFRLFFRTEYGESKLNYPLFENEGVKSFDKVDLRCAQNYSWSKGDGTESPLYTFTRDVFSRDIQGKMNQGYTRSRYYHLYINGLYWGLYQTEERPEASFAEAYLGGKREDYDVVKTASDIGGIEATDGNTDAWKEIWNMCQKGFSANADYYKIQGLNASGVRDPKIKVLVDIDNLIDYMNIIFYGGNYDAPVSAFGNNKSPNNFYAIYDRNGDRGFTFYAHDNEHTLLVDPINMSRGLTENRVNIGTLKNNMKMTVTDFNNFHPQWLHFKLSENAEYRQRFSDRSYKQYFNNGVFTPQKALELFKKRTLEIDTAIIAESARWGDVQNGVIRTKDDDWVPTVNKILTGFFPYRTDIVIKQLQDEGLLSLVNAPVFKFKGTEIVDENIKLSPGDALEIIDPANVGNVTYTIDGSDPRLVGDAVASTATNGGKTTTISILQSCIVKARVFNNGVWSPLHTLKISVDSQINGLQLTEINYNPLGQNGTSGGEYEFIELKNRGTTPIDLTKYLFIDGIKYNFSNETFLDPGKFFVLASNAFSFKERYGFSPSGEFEGQLDNKGERITLVNVIGDTIISVKYNNIEPWPTMPDSLGFSLVPAVSGFSADWNDGNNWRASSAVGGSPNADDGFVEIPKVLINEILSNSEAPQVDAIELYNPNNYEVNLGGWYLSDKKKTPKKWQIPVGTTIPANGYLVLKEGHYINSKLEYSSNEFGSSFSLSSYGEEVYLFSGKSTGELTGYEYGFDFGAIEPGVSIGRYINSVGKEHFVAQESPTFNAINGKPRVGPVVINQIMYNPTPDQFEYLELVNTSSSNVKLFDEENLAPWKVEGIGFQFPGNVALAPGQSVFLVQQEVSPSDFRAIFKLDSTVHVYNFTGSLKNEGEEITLFKSYKTYVENNEEKVSYIRIDKVNYNDNKLWPNADGNGYALQRVDSAAFGNDPASWIATPPGMRIKNSYLADATEGVYYSRELTTLGGIAPFSWSTSGGFLPDGLTLNPVSGNIDGIPTQIGTFNVNIRVEDSGGASKTVELTMKVNPNTLPLAVNDTILVYKNHAGSMDVLENDTDNDGDKSSWNVEIIGQPTHGNATLNNDRSITYTPNHNYLGADEITYHVTDAKGSSEAKLIINQVIEDWVILSTYQFVTQSSDDAEENLKTNTVDLTGPSLEMAFDATANASQLVGIRFQNLSSLPADAIIVNTFLIFNSAGVQTSPASLTIQGESSLNPVTYSTSNPISSRPVTTASVAWNPEPWEKMDDQEYSRLSADLTPIMNELIGKGWKQNMPIAFVIKGIGNRSARSVNNSQWNAPVLYVNYADPDAVVKTPVAAIKNITNIGKGERVQLDGTTSSSSDNRQLNYFWTLVSKPAGSNAQLSNPASPIPSFTADQFGDYVVSLKVDNGIKSSETVNITISVSNQPPIANAGSDQTKSRGSLIRLNGNGSSDANGDMLSYKWEWIQKPAGSIATLSSTIDINPKITADREGKYTLSLTVSDKFSSSTADFVDITVISNQPPLANAGKDADVVTGSFISLDGTKSSDPEDDKLTYTWSVLSKPAGSMAILTDSTVNKPVIQPDVAGEYIFSLKVSDGITISAPDEVKITAINNLPPIALAGEDQSTTEHLTVTLDGSESYDPEGKVIYYQWSFVSKPFGSIASILGANTAKPTLQPDTEGLYALKLRISDGTFTNEDQIQVTALNNVAVTTIKEFNSLKVYPNPFKDKLVVEYNSPINQLVTFSLYNLTGSLIKTFEFNSFGNQTQVLNFEDVTLKQGMYLLVMKPENNEPKVVKVNYQSR